MASTTPYISLKLISIITHIDIYKYIYLLIGSLRSIGRYSLYSLYLTCVVQRSKVQNDRGFERLNGVQINYSSSLRRRYKTADLPLYPSASAISCTVLPVWWSGEGREGRQRDKTRHAEEGQAKGLERVTPSMPRRGHLPPF